MDITWEVVYLVINLKTQEEIGINKNSYGNVWSCSEDRQVRVIKEKENQVTYINGVVKISNTTNHYSMKMINEYDMLVNNNKSFQGLRVKKVIG